MIDGASDVGIVERPATVVEGDVHRPERRFPLQPLRVVLLPPRGLPERDFGHRYAAREKLGGARQRLGDDAHGQRLACRRPSPVVRIGRKPQIVIVLPGDKPPRARADGTLAEVGRKGRGYDRRDRHREELGKNRERFGQRKRDRGVAQDFDPGDIACTPVGVGSSARDRQERPHAAAVGLGAQDAQEGALDISGDQRATVMERDGGPQVKDVT